VQRTSQLLLDIWREACRHIEIDEFLRTVSPSLVRHAPIEQVIVRRFDRETSSLITVAAAPPPAGEQALGERHDYAPADFKQLLRWGASDRIVTRGKRLTGILGLLVPEGIETDVIAVPLSRETEASGALLLIGRAGREFEDGHLELAEKLREPFAVALENDRRVHEMATLRDAAVADRGSLLRRLGRKEIVEDIVGERTGLRQVMDRVGLVTGSDVPVLILGETGTGKEVIARAIHTRSPRHDGPFIRVNCGAIPSELIDSQLFGHERGSFTGADQKRQGWFERADQGTLLLDEIGELPLDAQVRFLRVLQDGAVERVGGTQPVHVNVRIIAATHRDLAQMVREGRFREDLWYRLAVFPILMPPLRDRKDDIPDLANHFAERAAVRFGLPVNIPTEQDLKLLRAYDWPGNIREFGAVIDRAAILGNGQSLEIAKSLGFGAAPPPSPSRIETSPTTGSPSATSSDRFPTLDEAMIEHIRRALEMTEGQVEGRRGAAALLGINPHTLRARMRKHGVDWSEFRHPDSRR
jgi:transcriptional regulator with GAF, ATPase, and Fis domain